MVPPSFGDVKTAGRRDDRSRGRRRGRRLPNPELPARHATVSSGRGCGDGSEPPWGVLPLWRVSNDQGLSAVLVLLAASRDNGGCVGARESLLRLALRGTLLRRSLTPGTPGPAPPRCEQAPRLALSLVANRSRAGLERRARAVVVGAAPVHLMNETLSLPPECGASEVQARCTPVRDSSQPLAYAGFDRAPRGYPRCWRGGDSVRPQRPSLDVSRAESLA